MIEIILKSTQPSLCYCMQYLTIDEFSRMPVGEAQYAENEKHNHSYGGVLRHVCSLEDILKKLLLRWERSPTALDTEAKVLELEKPFSSSLNGDGNGRLLYPTL